MAGLAAAAQDADDAVAAAAALALRTMCQDAAGTAGAPLTTCRDLCRLLTEAAGGGRGGSTWQALNKEQQQQHQQQHQGHNGVYHASGTPAAAMLEPPGGAMAPGSPSRASPSAAQQPAPAPAPPLSPGFAAALSLATQPVPALPGEQQRVEPTLQANCSTAAQQRCCGSNRGLSVYNGVSWDKRKQRWFSQIQQAGRRHFLGYYESEQDAARAYDRAALRLYGPHAQLNLPDSMAAAGAGGGDTPTPDDTRTAAAATSAGTGSAAVGEQGPHSSRSSEPAARSSRLQAAGSSSGARRGGLAKTTSDAATRAAAPGGLASVLAVAAAAAAAEGAVVGDGECREGGEPVPAASLSSLLTATAVQQAGGSPPTPENLPPAFRPSLPSLAALDQLLRLQQLHQLEQQQHELLLMAISKGQQWPDGSHSSCPVGSMVASAPAVPPPSQAVLPVPPAPLFQTTGDAALRQGSAALQPAAPAGRQQQEPLAALLLGLLGQASEWHRQHQQHQQRLQPALPARPPPRPPQAAVTPEGFDSQHRGSQLSGSKRSGAELAGRQQQPRHAQQADPSQLPAAAEFLFHVAERARMLADAASAALSALPRSAAAEQLQAREALAGSEPALVDDR